MRVFLLPYRYLLPFIVFFCCLEPGRSVWSSASAAQLETAQVAEINYQQKPLKAEISQGLPDLDSVERRLAFYRDRLARWNMVAARPEAADKSDAARQERQAGCKTLAARVLLGYERLRKTLIADQPKEVEGVRFWEIAFADIHYLESGCEAGCDQPVNPSAAKPVEHLERIAKQSEGAIPALFQEENYQGVVTAFENGMAANSQWVPAPAISKMYGLSFVRLGRFMDGAQVLKEVISLEESDNDRSAMTRLVADLFLAAGNVREASAYYQKLSEAYAARGTEAVWIGEFMRLIASADLKSEEFAAFQRVIKSSLAFKGQWVPPELIRSVAAFAENFPNGIFLKRAKDILDEAKSANQAWIASQLAEVESLLADREFKRAKELIDRLLAGVVPAEMRETLLKIGEEVQQAETKDMEVQQQANQQTQAIQWSEAVNLLDSRRYDEAIELFSSLLGTPYEEEAKAKIELAVNQAANENRRQAANLFVKARKTQDQKDKEELLLESRQLLLDILKKYPGTEIIDKVKPNLKIIEDQIRNIDPALLKQAPKNQQLTAGE